jgi:hypothetical protein
MSKIVIAGMTALCAGILGAAPFSLRVSPMASLSVSLDSAGAVIGRPLTLVSIAGVHRKADRRAYYGYAAYYHPFRHYRYGTSYGGYRPYGYGTTYQPYEYGTYQTGNGYGYGMYLPYRFYGYNAYRPYRVYGDYPHYHRAYRY